MFPDSFVVPVIIEFSGISCVCCCVNEYFAPFSGSPVSSSVLLMLNTIAFGVIVTFAEIIFSLLSTSTFSPSFASNVEFVTVIVPSVAFSLLIYEHVLLFHYLYFRKVLVLM